MTLDDRINQDLGELFDGKDISVAKTLSSVFANPFSERGLPNHFTGNRNAVNNTVFVMLNPGIEVKKANSMFLTLTALYNRSSKAAFINSYIADKTSITVSAPDPFDVKQAAFLKPWVNSGISLAGFDPNNKSTYLTACANVLNQKLQLEFVPYCSSSFENINGTNMIALLPFVETLFNEISSKERKYVIFGSGKFEALFKQYNKICHKSIVFVAKAKTSSPIFGNKSACCTKVLINYDNKQFKAIIANTFPYRYYGTYKNMEKYGEFCFHNY